MKNLIKFNKRTFPIANNAPSKNKIIPKNTNVTPNIDKPMPISKNSMISWFKELIYQTYVSNYSIQNSWHINN